MMFKKSGVKPKVYIGSHMYLYVKATFLYLTARLWLKSEAKVRH